MRRLALHLKIMGLMTLGVALLAGCSDDAFQSQRLAAQGVYTGALSTDGRFVLIGSMNHGSSLWQTAEHERLFNWNHSADGFTDLTATAFAPDGSKAVTAQARDLVVWDTQTGKDLAYWGSPGNLLSIALASSGRQLLLGMQDHSAVLIDPTSGHHLRTLLHDAPVGAVVLGLDGKQALTGSDDETAVLWDLASGTAVHTLVHDNSVRVVAMSATGRYLFTAAQARQAILWDGATGEPIHQIEERNPGVLSATFSPDENLLLLGYVNRQVTLWSTQSNRQLGDWHIAAENPLHTQGGAVLAVGFTQDPGVFLALTGDGRLSELRSSPQK
jgi:WD40 repeat protein